MQKQKTLAKWLAVILLLTVAVACYIALNAIIPKSNSREATATATENAEPTSTDNSNKLDAQTQLKTPVFSSFPRHAEQIGSTKINHLGGENDERFLDSYTLGEKTYILFSSESEEYDTRGRGIYIAVLQNDYVLSVEYLAANENYLASTLAKNGLFIATQDDTKTIFRLVSNNCETIAESYASIYKSMLFCIDKATRNIRMFCANETTISAYLIDDNLSLTKETYSLFTQDAQLEYLLDFSSFQLLFIDSQDEFLLVSYSQNNGFTIKNRLINREFVQILPNSSTSSFAFATLFKSACESEKSLLVATYDANGNMIASYSVADIDSGVLKQDYDMLELFTAYTKYQFCSHLELVSKTKYTLDDSLFVKPVSLKNVDGTDMFLRFDGITFQLVNTSLETLFTAKGKNVYANCSPPISSSNKYRLIFEAKNNDVLTYMTFGGYDVFMIDVN